MENEPAGGETSSSSKKLWNFLLEPNRRDIVKWIIGTVITIFVSVAAFFYNLDPVDTEHQQKTTPNENVTPEPEITQSDDTFLIPPERLSPEVERPDSMDVGNLAQTEQEQDLDGDWVENASASSDMVAFVQQKGVLPPSSQDDLYSVFVNLNKQSNKDHIGLNKMKTAFKSDLDYGVYRIRAMVNMDANEFFDRYKGYFRKVGSKSGRVETNFPITLCSQQKSETYSGTIPPAPNVCDDRFSKFDHVFFVPPDDKTFEILHDECRRADPDGQDVDAFYWARIERTKGFTVLQELKPFNTSQLLYSVWLCRRVVYNDSINYPTEK